MWYYGSNLRENVGHRDQLIIRMPFLTLPADSYGRNRTRVPCSAFTTESRPLVVTW